MKYHKETFVFNIFHTCRIELSMKLYILIVQCRKHFVRPMFISLQDDKNIFTMNIAGLW